MATINLWVGRALNQEDNLFQTALIQLDLIICPLQALLCHPGTCMFSVDRLQGFYRSTGSLHCWRLWGLPMVPTSLAMQCAPRARGWVHDLLDIHHELCLCNSTRLQTISEKFRKWFNHDLGRWLLEIYFLFSWSLESFNFQNFNSLASQNSDWIE